MASPASPHQARSSLPGPDLQSSWLSRVLLVALLAAAGLTSAVAQDGASTMSACTATAGRLVQDGDCDLGDATLAVEGTYCFADLNGDGLLDGSDRIILALGVGDTCAVAALGDLDLSGCYCRITSGHPAAGVALADLNDTGGESWWDGDGDGLVDAGDVLYLDQDGDGTVTVGDVRLTESSGLQKGRQVVVADDDVGRALQLAGLGGLCHVDDDGDALRDVAEPLYLGINQPECGEVALGDARLSSRSASGGGGGGGGGGTGTATSTGTPTGTGSSSSSSSGGPLPPAEGLCFGHELTIVGTAGKDKLVGTEGDDVIYGGPGDDTIDGRGGDDLLCGGPGADTLFGGPGNDWLEGDLVVLGSATHPAAFYKDALDGGPGADYLVGDALYADGWTDAGPGRTITMGNDVLRDTDQDWDWLYGDFAALGGDGWTIVGGNDKVDLSGRTQAVGDWLDLWGASTGRGGNDEFKSGASESAAYLGDWIQAHTAIGGDDTFKLGDAVGQPFLAGDYLWATASAQGGHDRFAVSLMEGGSLYGDHLRTGSSDGAQLGGGSDRIDVKQAACCPWIVGDDIHGSYGNDTLRGGQDTIAVKSGDASLVGDWLVGGTGGDAIVAGDDKLSGGDGDDWIVGDHVQPDDWDVEVDADGDGGLDPEEDLDGNGRLDADGPDVVHLGNDTITTGPGRNFALGDQVSADVSAEGDSIHFGRDRLTGGPGSDGLRGDDVTISFFSEVLPAVPVGLDLAADTLDGGAGDDSLLAGFLEGTTQAGPHPMEIAASRSKLMGGSGNDFLSGILAFGQGSFAHEGNLFLGGAGNDAFSEMVRASGDWALELGTAAVDGGPGQDDAWCDGADVSVNGGAGFDRTFGPCASVVAVERSYGMDAEAAAQAAEGRGRAPMPSEWPDGPTAAPAEPAITSPARLYPAAMPP